MIVSIRVLDVECVRVFHKNKIAFLRMSVAFRNNLEMLSNVYLVLKES